MNAEHLAPAALTEDQKAFNLKSGATIYEHFGNRAFRMIGATHIVNSSSERMLGFRFKMYAAANYVKISVVNDLYTLEFCKIRGTSIKWGEKVEGVFFTELRLVFSRLTGLCLNL